MSRHSARQFKDRALLTERTLLRTLRRALPKRNGYVNPNCAELLDEARRFGVMSAGQLRRLLLKHRRELIADDRAALHSANYMRAIAADRGEHFVAQLRRKQCCFAWEALMRNAFELEFGDAYETFARERDGP